MRKMTMALAASAGVVIISGFFFYNAARGSHRARFVMALNELRGANAQLQQQGTFTNRSAHDKVYPCTNRFNIEGAVYECQLAVESVDLYLKDRGLLTITTNDIIVWVDKKRGVMPLGSGSAFRFPPGF